MFSSSSTNRSLPFPPPHPFLCHDGGQDTTFSFSQYYYNNTDLLMSDFLLANFPAMDSISPPPPPPPSMAPPLVLNKTPTMSTATANQDYDQKLGFPRKKKHGKADRHSKICTAQGQRDRRVRLSIGIARRFFDLQDMLGFDKASKTIDWLLDKSKAAIKEVSDECNFEEEQRVKKAASSSPCPARESRAKARARARERTIEKLSSKHSDLMIKKKQSSPADCDQNWEISGSSSHSSNRAMNGMDLSPEFEVCGRSWEVFNYKNNQKQS